MSTATPLPPDEPPVFSYTSDSARLPLDSAYPHIRLLKLQGTTSVNAEDPVLKPIFADIFVTPISSAPEFKALSYTWGTDERTHRISLSGTAFHVTPSLDLALRHLRLEAGQSVILWIDQICINQDDEAEKTAQVNLMRQIYTGAEQVVVWLGPAADESDLLMDYLSGIGEIAACANMDNESLWGLSCLQFPDEIFRKKARDPKFQILVQFLKFRSGFDPVLPAFIAWCRRPWFTRVWVVQESALNPDTVFRCGRKMLDAETLTLAISVLRPCLVGVVTSHQQPQANRSYETSPTPKLALAPCQFDIRRRYQSTARLQGGPGLPILDLLVSAHAFGGACATRVEGRVFGLLALARDAKRLGISAEYTGTDTMSVLSRVAASIMSDSGCLDLLGLAQGSEELPLLPSWVPDWGPYTQTSYYGWDMGRPLFSASGNVKSGRISRSGLVLELEGIQVDIVEDVCFPLTNGGYHEFENPLLILRCIIHLAMLSEEKNRPLYADPERRQEIPWRVPIGDLEVLGGNGWCHRASSVAKRWFRELFDSFREPGWSLDRWKQNTRLNSDGTDSATGGEVSGEGNYLSCMARMKWMRPFLTKEGYVGMGPLTLRPGDVIMVLMGASVPFALRPVAGEANQFSLVGDTYCDGVMDGEMMTTGKAPIPISLV